MKRILTFIILTTLSIPSFSSKGAEISPEDTLTASEVFTNLPLSVLDLVDKSRRLDMLDYYAADSIAHVANAMEGLSYLDTVTPSYLKVILTPVTELGIKVLPCKKAPVILTAYTIGDNDQAYDTDLRFFDSDFNELRRDKMIKIATLDDFFNYPDKETKKRVAALIPFPTMRYEADADGTGLTAELTVGQFMSADDYNSVRKYMRPKLHYKWTGTKFNLEK